MTLLAGLDSTPSLIVSPGWDKQVLLSTCLRCKLLWNFPIEHPAATLVLLVKVDLWLSSSAIINIKHGNELPLHVKFTPKFLKTSVLNQQPLIMLQQKFCLKIKSITQIKILSIFMTKRFSVILFILKAFNKKCNSNPQCIKLAKVGHCYSMCWHKTVSVWHTI